jgi:hypothetical protein
MKKCSLESVRQISRQKPAKASVVRQPKKVYCGMIGMGAKSITIVRAVTDDFFVHNDAQDLRLESFQNFNVGGGSSSPELYTVGPDGFGYGFID